MTAKELGQQPAHPNSHGLECRVGLTKREAFAMAADIPWNSVVDAIDQKNRGSGHISTNKEVIKYRALLMVLQADALLEELAKEQP